MVNGGRYLMMMVFVTGTAIMYLLWSGFNEAGLSETAGKAFAATWVWLMFSTLHTGISFRVFNKLEKTIGECRGDKA